MKVVLNLWDGVRFDAIFKVNDWMGLPNLFRVIKNGVLYTNIYTEEPALTPQCVARIMCNRRGKWISQSLWEKMHKRSCFVGYPEDSVRGYLRKIPHCELLDVLYKRKLEAYLKSTPEGRKKMNKHRMCYPDEFRMKVARRMIPKYDFTFVYFPGPDSAAHDCRDQKKHIYHHGSPYVHAIKNCDRLLGKLLQTLDRTAPNDYVVMIVADHGMSDEGRHSIGKWTDKIIMQVPFAVMGKGIRSNWYEQSLYHTYDITSGIVGLFKGDAHNTIFRHALRNHS
ncbi:alkaline phosphatase family protein [bacterium]|nr:alkaline phosphatase family protein [bacterium]